MGTEGLKVLKVNLASTLVSMGCPTTDGGGLGAEALNSRQNGKKQGNLTEGPPPGTNFRLSLNSPESELKELQSLNIKLKSYVSVLLARGIYGPFTDSAKQVSKSPFCWKIM